MENNNKQRIVLHVTKEHIEAFQAPGGEGPGARNWPCPIDRALQEQVPDACDIFIGASFYGFRISLPNGKKRHVTGVWPEEMQAKILNIDAGFPVEPFDADFDQADFDYVD